MNVAAKKFFVYPLYNHNFKPCRLDICSCLIRYNLQSSYTDRFKYKKCYDKIEWVFSTHRRSAGHSFDEGV